MVGAMTANGYTGNPPGSGGGGGGAVDSVNGRTGAVVLSKTDVGLANVDNTSDPSKPVSTATATALTLKAPVASPTFTGTVSGVTKAMVGLGSVDNTSDLSKPVSTAVSNALGLKADLASPTFTGTVSGVSKAMVGLANVDNTSDLSKPVSTATSAALALKADLASPAITGNPTAPTQTPGDSSTKLATTAYVSTAVAAVGGGGGGTAATFARAYVDTGDITPGVTGAFTAVSGLTLPIAAVAGDDLTITLSCLLNQTAGDFFELVVLNGGSIVRYSSTGTGSPSAAGEGDPSIYPLNGATIRATTASWSFVATSGDIAGGNVTFALAFKGSGSGKVFASTNYPLRWHARNDH